MRRVRWSGVVVAVVLLVDSSVWVLAKARLGMVAYHAEANELAVCPAVMNEVLRGARDSRDYKRIREMFLTLVVLDRDVPLERFEEAAQLYTRCREAGYTVRNSFDCLIAATAIAHDATLLHRDSDFEYIARVMPLRLQRI